MIFYSEVKMEQTPTVMTTLPDVRYEYNYRFWKFEDRHFRDRAKGVLKRLRLASLSAHEHELIDELIDDIDEIRKEDFVIHSSLRLQYQKVRDQEARKKELRDKLNATGEEEGVDLVITDWSPGLLERVTKETMRQALLHAGHQEDAAKILGISPHTLRKRRYCWQEQRAKSNKNLKG